MLAGLRVEAKAAVLLVKSFPVVTITSFEFFSHGLLGLSPPVA